MSFTKMYLVTEDEFNKLKKRKPPKLPEDVQLVTNSLKAVSQKRKREAISATVPRIKHHNVKEGVASMKDADVEKPLRGRQLHSTPVRHHRRGRARQRSLSFGTPIGAMPMLQHYPV